MATVIVYHVGCPDGTTAAWVTALAHHPAPVIFEAGNYAETLRPPESYADDDVILVDYSWPRDHLAAVAQHAASVLVLDHHQTAMADLTPPPDGVDVVFDMDRSGAMIAYDHWTATRPTFTDWALHGWAGKLCAYVQDRDLWRMELPHSQEVTAWLRLMMPTEVGIDVTAWHVAMENIAWAVYHRFDRVVQDGALLLARQTGIVNELADQAWWVSIAGLVVPIAPAVNSVCSDVAAELNRRHPDAPFAAYFILGPRDVRVGLRSVGDFDVSEVAKEFGGGGHRNAAGLRLPHDAWIATIKDWRPR
jgi:hypothetical protein